jgi:hypothetical protein
MSRYSTIRDFRDIRTGRYRKAAHFEKNKYFKIDTLTRGIASFVFKTLDHMTVPVEDFANDLVTYARDNAPWQDRTGDARAGLIADVTIDNEELIIDLTHTVDYGIWLEIRWGGKYAIIIPTVETVGPRIFDHMQGMLGDIIYYD